MTRSRFAYTILIPTVTTLLHLAGSTQANAAETSGWDACGGTAPQYSLDQQIAGCTADIAHAPQHTEAFNNRCSAYTSKGELALALPDCTRAIELNPNFPLAFYNRGNVYYLMGRYDEAIEDYSRAIAIFPFFALAFNNRGAAHNLKHEYDLAIADFDRATGINPNYADPFLNRGVSRINKGEYELAIEDFNHALSLNPNFAKAYFGRGHAYLEIGKFDEAIADSQHALQLEPKLTLAGDDLKEAQEAKAALLTRANVTTTGARVALVIGNSRYLNSPRLPNAANDAEDVAAELTRLGYKVFGFPKTDFVKSDLEAEIEAFKKATLGASAAVVWYSGHGQEMREEGNDIAQDWIIPVDAKIAKRADVAPNAIRLDTLKIAVLAAKTLRVVVIDACRNNTFYSGDRATRGLSRSAVSPGVLVIYSTQPGNVAEDGQGRNSPFAQAFLTEVRRAPSRDVRQLFGAVQGGVMGLTSNDQKPQIDDGLATGNTLTLAR